MIDERCYRSVFDNDLVHVLAVASFIYHLSSLFFHLFLLLSFYFHLLILNIFKNWFGILLIFNKPDYMSLYIFKNLFLFLTRLEYKKTGLDILQFSKTDYLYLHIFRKIGFGIILFSDSIWYKFLKTGFGIILFSENWIDLFLIFTNWTTK